MMKTIVMLRHQVTNLGPRNDENYSHAQASGNESGARNDENYSLAQASGIESMTPQ
jgi:hypothetical protein